MRRGNGFVLNGAISICLGDLTEKRSRDQDRRLAVSKASKKNVMEGGDLKDRSVKKEGGGTSPCKGIVWDSK